MNQVCEKSGDLAAKLLSQVHWSEEEKTHFLACECCQKTVDAAIESRRKGGGPASSSMRPRSDIKRKLERVQQLYERDLGISLKTGLPVTPDTKAS
jgi:hypothetical protein